MSTKELVKSNSGTDKKPDEAICITKNYWFMTQEFKKNDVYNFLEGLRDAEKKELLITAVLSIDFGGGETTAYAIIREIIESQEQGKRYEYNKIRVNITEKSAVIPTMIGFEGEKTVIGNDAQYCSEFYQQFKMHPGKDTVDDGKEENWHRFKDKYTYKELMSRFFREVFNSILNNESGEVSSLQKAYKDKTLLVCVGCPASDKWLNRDARKDFEELIKEATGNPYVAIVPESTASLLTGMDSTSKESEKNKVDISKGIAVFDCGSISIDFTFILPGGIIITRSADKGGYHIDQLILNAALAEAGKTRADIADDRESYLIEARKAKERYYDFPNSKKNKFLCCGKEILVDKDFMDKKVWGKGAGKDHPGQKLLEEYKSFIRVCYESVEQDGCKNVIVTGGTGKVRELREIVKMIFKTDNREETSDKAASTHFIPQENPSFCVSQGLCIAKKVDMIGVSYLDSYRSAAKSESNTAYSNIIRKISEKIVPAFIPEFKKAVESHINQEGKMKIEELTAAVEEEIKNNPDGFLNDRRNLEKILSEAIVVESGEFTQKMKKKADEILKKIYGESFAFSDNLLDGNLALADGKNVADMDMIDISAVITELFSNNVLSNVMFYFSSVIIGILIGMFLHSPFFIPGFFLIDKKKFSRFVNKQVVKVVDMTGGVSSDKRAELMAKADDEKFVKTLIESTSEELEKQAFLKEEITDYFEITAEAIFGKILFYIYDKKPKVQ